jgi:hypothetical protein
MTIDDALFYGVYLAQILVVSLYLPDRVVQRARGLFATHPPAEFPKLYPVPVATIERTLRIYRNSNLGVVAIGLALLAADGFSGYTIDSAWANWQEGEPYPIRNDRAVAFVSSLYTLLQCLLSIGLFAYFESRYFRRMKATAPGRIRTAELKARRLFDFVSPALLGTAMAAYAAVAVFLLALDLPGNVAAIMIALLTLTNACMTGCSIWLLYGRRHDPYQAREDRARAMRQAWRGMVVASILLSALYGIAGALIEVELFDYMLFASSLFAQAVAAFLAGKFSSVVLPFGPSNFDVYRADTNRPTAMAT